MDVLTFVEEAGRVETSHGLFTLLLDAVRPRGLDYVAYGMLTCKAPARDASILPTYLVLNDSEDLVKHYVSNSYHVIDPETLYLSSMVGDFKWDTLIARFSLDPPQLTLFGEAQEAALAEGVSVPIHGSYGQVAVVSFAAQTSAGPLAADLRELMLLAAQFHVSYCRLANRETHEIVHLSAREKECLSWTAVGKSSWDIGVILTISENTVNFHLKNVMKKLGTSSRVVAVLKAIKLGLISVSSL